MTEHKKPQATRRSESFPPQFAALFKRASQSSIPIIIDNLGPDRTKYTSLRARLNQYRAAFRKEAHESGNQALQSIADEFDRVVIRAPEQVGGQWRIEVAQREQSFGEAIGELLTNLEGIDADDPEGAKGREGAKRMNPNPEPPLSGAAAISELFDKGSDK